MKSEEILKKLPNIEKALIKNPPELYIEFSLFKRDISTKIPSDAITTKQKVVLYYNLATNSIGFSKDGKTSVKMHKWWDYYVCAYTMPLVDDAICLSCWNIPVKDINVTKWNRTTSLDIKPKLEFFIILNKNKEFIGTPVEIVYREITKTSPIVAKSITEFTYHNWVVKEFATAECVGIREALKKTFGVGLIGGNTYIDFSNFEELYKFLSYAEPRKRETKRQQFVDELLKIELKVPKMTFKGQDSLICVASKVNDTFSTLRWFLCDANNKPYEISRLYIDKNNHYFCRKNTYGEYVVLNNKLSSKSFDAEKVIIQDKDAFKGTKLEYFESIYKELKPAERAPALYMLTLFPEFEKFYKAGLKRICKNYLEMQWQCSWTTYIEGLFGKINPKEKTITKILGFNKYQLSLIESHCPKKISYWSSGVGKQIKDIFDVNDCNTIDNTTFETYLNAITGNNYQWYIKEALKHTTRVYSVKVCMNMIPRILAVKDKACHTTQGRWTYNANAVSLYCDYVRTVELLGAARTMRPQFDTAEDILRMHDDAAAVYNLKKDAVDLERFKARIPIWKKWEYDENEKYIVIAPTKPEDLAAEGITLHHCVKSYIPRVTSGTTNIMFIREKDKIEEPFFTVEVSNKGAIEQVHGFGNRNANTEPGLEEFVREWIKKKKLSDAGHNKIR